MSKDLVAKLNDPNYVKELARRHGLIKDDAPTTRKSQRKPPELIDIAKLTDPDEIIKALAQNQQKLVEYIDTTVDGEFTAREQERTQAEKTAAAAAEQKKVREFAKKVPDYVQLFDEIKKHYQVSGDIVEAYKAAREETGNPVTAAEEAKWNETAPTKPATGTKPKPRLPDTSQTDEDLDDPDKRKKVSDKSVKERTGSIIDNVLKEHNLESLEIEAED